MLGRGAVPLSVLLVPHQVGTEAIAKFVPGALSSIVPRALVARADSGVAGSEADLLLSRPHLSFILIPIPILG